MEKFCYLDGTIGARGGADDIVITRTRSEGSKFSNSVPLVTRFALKAKNALYSVCACSVMLHGRETRLVQVK